MPAAAADVPCLGLHCAKARFSMSWHYIEIFPKPRSFNGMPSKKESMSRHIIETIPEPNSFNSFSLSNQAQFALVCPSLVFYAWNYIGVIPKSTSSCTCQPGMGRLKAEWHLLQTPACPGWPADAIPMQGDGQCTRYRFQGFLVFALFFSCISSMLVHCRQLNLVRDKDFIFLQQKPENHQSQINPHGSLSVRCY